ncbi:hypothetical protein Vadar_032261 [Vaccinium darrowii]|uniref:Uncharacterized protein n=1 Tax=Vaccinium darrowii TaxID=229202 RepID=A0ACB7YA46_9ERIC|nr:hypothetical protein Vadar_032261 [Vaccinium darrowii]
MGWFGRRVSVGESKLCQIIVPFGFLKTRLPVSRSFNSSGGIDLVFVDQTVNWSASVSMRSPDLRRVSFESSPLMGWSRLAVQTTVRLLSEVGLANHMEKQ